MKIIVLAFIAFVLLSFIEINGNYKRIITTASDTIDADSVEVLVSDWIPVGSSENVALFLSASDSAWIRCNYSYRFDTWQQVVNTADSLSIDNRASSTFLSKGKVLRGYGLTTDLMPGGTEIQCTLTVRTPDDSIAFSTHLGILIEE